jgi:hypothetical protein
MPKSDLIARVQQRTGRSMVELTQILDTVRDSLVVKPTTLALLRSQSERRVPLFCLSDMPVSVFTHVRQRYDILGHFSRHGHFGRGPDDEARASGL